MNNIDIATSLILKELKIPIKDYSKCKNAIYLVQAKEIVKNFFWYRWSVNGVSSVSHEDNFPEFADTYYELSINEKSGIYNDEFKGARLDADTIKKLNELKPLIDSTKDLELLVATHFLINRSKIKNQKEILKVLSEHKYTIPEDFKSEIISSLIQYSLINEKEIKD